MQFDLGPVRVPRRTKPFSDRAKERPGVRLAERSRAAIDRADVGTNDRLLARMLTTSYPSERGQRQ